jgi:hypothetical protein
LIHTVQRTEEALVENPGRGEVVGAPAENFNKPAHQREVGKLRVEVLIEKEGDCQTIVNI